MKVFKHSARTQLYIYKWQLEQSDRIVAAEKRVIHMNKIFFCLFVKPSNTQSVCRSDILVFSLWHTVGSHTRLVSFLPVSPGFVSSWRLLVFDSQTLGCLMSSGAAANANRANSRQLSGNQELVEYFRETVKVWHVWAETDELRGRWRVKT